MSEAVALFRSIGFGLATFLSQSLAQEIQWKLRKPHQPVGWPTHAATIAWFHQYCPAPMESSSLGLLCASFFSWLTEWIWIQFPTSMLPLDETPNFWYTWRAPSSYIQGDSSSALSIQLCYLERRYQVPSAKGSIQKDYLLPSLWTLASYQTTSRPPSHMPYLGTYPLRPWREGNKVPACLG